MVSIYRHCVNGARHETHCNKPIAVQSHLTFMQNYILDEYEAVCVVERGKELDDPPKTESEMRSPQ